MNSATSLSESAGHFKSDDVECFCLVPFWHH